MFTAAALPSVVKPTRSASFKHPSVVTVISIIVGADSQRSATRLRLITNLRAACHLYLCFILKSHVPNLDVCNSLV